MTLTLSGDYLQAKSLLGVGDVDSRFSSRLSVDWSPLEWLSVGGSAHEVLNRNTLIAPRGYVLSGDPMVWLEGRLALGPLWGALEADVTLPTAAGEGISLSALSVRARAILSFERAGFEAHLNVGIGDDRTSQAFANPPGLLDRFVGEFQPGAYAPGALGLEYAIGPVKPFAEYSFEYVFGRSYRESPSRLAAGARLFPFGRDELQVVAAVEIGFGKGAVDVPPTPPWIIGLSLAYRPTSRPPVVREVIREVPGPAPACPPAAAAAPVVGTLVGRVIDSATKVAIADARVQIGNGVNALATSADGRFASCSLPPGPVQITVTAPGFKPADEAARVVAGSAAEIEITLTRAGRPSSSWIRGHVRNPAGVGVRATIDLPALKIHATANASGRFEFEAPPGAYELEVSFPGLLPQKKFIRLSPGQTVIYNIDLDAPK